MCLRSPADIVHLRSSETPNIRARISPILRGLQARPGPEETDSNHCAALREVSRGKTHAATLQACEKRSTVQTFPGSELSLVSSTVMDQGLMHRRSCAASELSCKHLVLVRLLLASEENSKIDEAISESLGSEEV